VIDIIARIDEVTSSVCGWCSAKLTADNYSEDFCSEAHQENWNRDRAGMTTTSPRVASVVRSSPDGDETVLEIVVDTSHFESALRVMRESALRLSRAIAGNRIRHSIIDESRSWGWTDIGFTDGGVIEATPVDDPSTAATREERMQAALDARRNRNTGPTHLPRAPKNLGGRTSR
jgi:hypothetical protein